jgi:hypothetical protein
MIGTFANTIFLSIVQIKYVNQIGFPGSMRSFDSSVLIPLQVIAFLVAYMFGGIATFNAEELQKKVESQFGKAK